MNLTKERIITLLVVIANGILGASIGMLPTVEKIN